jgi:hypothetical protein
MKKLFGSLVLVISMSMAAKAQIGYLPMRTAPAYTYMDSTSLAAKKWSLQPYAGFSTSFSSFKGGSATIFSVPLGLQLTRQLNNNLYAFAGIYAAPSYVNFNRAFMNAPMGKFNSANMSLYSGIEGGLMYINDQRTFSISGSIRVEQNNFPAYPYYNPNNLQKQPVYNNR